MNLPLANTGYVEQDEPCKNDTHSENNHELFTVTGNDSGFVGTDDLY